MFETKFEIWFKKKSRIEQGFKLPKYLVSMKMCVFEDGEEGGWCVHGVPGLQMPVANELP